jgi:hypothetical protein
MPSIFSNASAPGLQRVCSFFVSLFLLFHVSPPAQANDLDQPTVIIVVGAAGEESYGRDFSRSAKRWQDACRDGNAVAHLIGLDEPDDRPDLDKLRALLTSLSCDTDLPLWIVLIGHGTFDGTDARFNLRGPDFTATDMAEWLVTFKRPIALINGASASAPFLPALSGPNRVIVTATRSGYEHNYARFGLHFAEAIANPEADLDKDGQTSILEAFLIASARVAEFYETEGRLATEHALIDDNGDALGTPTDWFQGLRVEKKSADGNLPDGLRARQWHLVPGELERLLASESRQRRDQLELQIAHLRQVKADVHEEDYYRQLEIYLLELAELYESLDAPPQADPP